MSKSRLSALFALFIFAALSPGASRAEGAQSLRLKLHDSSAVATLYSIDDYITLVTAEGQDPEPLLRELDGLCSQNGGKSQTGAEGRDIACQGYFEAKTAGEGAGSERLRNYFIIKHSSPQPFSYKERGRRLYSEVSAPPDGAIKNSADGVSVYEYMYALCKQNNGVPVFILPQKNGKHVRMTQVDALKAFSYLLADSGRNDAWFFACDGSRKFLVENYFYVPEKENKFFFFANRGLEGINYVKASGTGLENKAFFGAPAFQSGS